MLLVTSRHRIEETEGYLITKQNVARYWNLEQKKDTGKGDKIGTKP